MFAGLGRNGGRTRVDGRGSVYEMAISWLKKPFLLCVFYDFDSERVSESVCMCAVDKIGFPYMDTHVVF